MKIVPAAFLSVFFLASAAQAAEPVMPAAAEALHFKRFETEIAAFAKPLVAGNAMQGAETLFVGSSSIRLWDVTTSFPHLRAINHGFGGATTADVLHYYREVVAGTAPSTVIVYIGENDIADGVAPERVAANVLILLGQLRRDMPKARIAYLSMKPTPSRWELYPRMAAVNAEISARAKAGGQFDYLDVASALMGAQGRPSDEYFGADRLHMNTRGYARWNALIETWLAAEAPRQRLAQSVQGAS